ncbi:hypothetical protein BDQ12DRAFT_670984 [Crucibulum laeve]|uniref:Uncharacterized protein n=1 Tax=Crucibulum laeve TaxID=68775 RepID=A0A5C3LIC9_9AGAR|nr:hypothetical protein BDQ12DRAFT_670984 [Crucibulum laeve]
MPKTARKPLLRRRPLCCFVEEDERQSGLESGRCLVDRYGWRGEGVGFERVDGMGRGPNDGNEESEEVTGFTGNGSEGAVLIEFSCAVCVIEFNVDGRGGGKHESLLPVTRLAMHKTTMDRSTTLRLSLLPGLGSYEGVALSVLRRSKNEAVAAHEVK